MTDDAYNALRAAVNLARFEQIRSVSSLKSRLACLGYRCESIAEAIQTWANYERAKRAT